jgi:hypothetical protein
MSEVRKVAERLPERDGASPDLPSGRDSEDAGVLRVDRQHAVVLGGEAAGELCDTLGRAAREGLKLTKAARAGDVFELVPPEHLAQGIRTGALRAATPQRGDASVLIKNTKTGRIAGRSDLRRVKPSPVDIIGPAAWQALALATQQHYLAEISEKLDDIKAGVDEVLARLDDDRIGTLNDISELAAGAQVAARRDGRLSAVRTSELRRAAADAKRLWHQVSTTARRQLADYRSGKASATAVEQSFAMLVHATRVLAQCSEALVSVPYTSESELQAAVADEQDRLHPAVPTFAALCEELLHASEEWRSSHSDYEGRRPKNVVARTLRVPPVAVARHKGRLDIDVRFRPEQEPLPESVETRFRDLAATGATGPSPRLVAEVQPDGRVLLGPARLVA